MNICEVGPNSRLECPVCRAVMNRIITDRSSCRKAVSELAAHISRSKDKDHRGWVGRLKELVRENIGVFFSDHTLIAKYVRIAKLPPSFVCPICGKAVSRDGLASHLLHPRQEDRHVNWVLRARDVVRAGMEEAFSDHELVFGYLERADYEVRERYSGLNIVSLSRGFAELDGIFLRPLI